MLAAADAVVLPFRSGGGSWNRSIAAAALQGTFVLTTSSERHRLDPTENVYYARQGTPENLRMGSGGISVAGARPPPVPPIPTWTGIAEQHLAIYWPRRLSPVPRASSSARALLEASTSGAQPERADCRGSGHDPPVLRDEAFPDADVSPPVLPGAGEAPLDPFLDRVARPDPIVASNTASWPTSVKMPRATSPAKVHSFSTPRSPSSSGSALPAAIGAPRAQRSGSRGPPCAAGSRGGRGSRRRREARACGNSARRIRSGSATPRRGSTGRTGPAPKSGRRSSRTAGRSRR